MKNSVLVKVKIIGFHVLNVNINAQYVGLSNQISSSLHSGSLINTNLVLFTFSTV